MLSVSSSRYRKLTPPRTLSKRMPLPQLLLPDAGLPEVELSSIVSFKKEASVLRRSLEAALLGDYDAALQILLDSE